MALDTQEKRMSATGVGRPYLRARFPVGATDEQSRMNSANVYGGNALSAAASTIMAQARSVSRFVFSRVWGRVN